MHSNLHESCRPKCISKLSATLCGIYQLVNRHYFPRQAAPQASARIPRRPTDEFAAALPKLPCSQSHTLGLRSILAPLAPPRMVKLGCSLPAGPTGFVGLVLLLDAGVDVVRVRASDFDSAESCSAALFALDRLRVRPCPGAAAPRPFAVLYEAAPPASAAEAAGLSLDALPDAVAVLAAARMFDFVAVSGTGGGVAVAAARASLLAGGAPDVPVLARVHDAAGLDVAETLLREADGIVLCRDELAAAVPLGNVALAQKHLAAAAAAAGKLFVCEGGVMSSMAAEHAPTSAESADVANLAADGADCILLSDTAASSRGGPTATLAAAAALCSAQSSAAVSDLSDTVRSTVPETDTVSALERSAFGIAAACAKRSARLVVTVSTTGKLARLVSKHRPPCPQVVVSTGASVVRRACMVSGQLGVLVENLSNLDSVFSAACDAAVAAQIWSGQGAVVYIHCGGQSDVDSVEATLKVIEK